MRAVKVAKAWLVVLGVLLAGLSLVSVYATVFSHRLAYARILVNAPVVWFEDPKVPGVTPLIHRNGTSATVEVKAGYELALSRRSAVYYDTFDDNPFAAGRLVSYACSWSYNATERAVAISATRSNATWGFYCVALVNPVALNISRFAIEGRTIYVGFLTWRTAFSAADSPSIKVDAVYLNSTSPHFYTVGYYVSLLTYRTGDTHYSNISLRTPAATTVISWRRLGTLLYLEYEYVYHVSTSIDFAQWTALHYVNETFTHASSIRPDLRYIPYAVGLGYWNSTGVASGTVYFDNLVVTVDHPPWYVNVTGVPSGWIVVLKNATGHVVANATSIGGLARLVVAPQVAVDRSISPWWRNAFVFPNAIIEIYNPAYSNVTPVYTRRFDVVLGGDLYVFRLVFDNVLLSVYSNLDRGFNTMLANAAVDYVPLVNASIGMVSWSGDATAANITVLNGVLIRGNTSQLYVEPPPSWSGKWLTLNVTARLELPLNVTSYKMEFNFTWWVKEGVIAIYRVEIVVK